MRFTQWEYAGTLEGVSGECPNFFPLQDKWVLIRSTHPITIRYSSGSLNVAGTAVPLMLSDSKTLKLHVFIDKSVLELFINDGVSSVTRVEYPGEEDLAVSVFAENGAVTLKSLDAWEMNPIW